MTTQAIVFVHGIGEQTVGYADDMIRLLDRRTTRMLKRAGLDIENPGFAYAEVLWAPVTSVPQADLWRRVNKGQRLDMVRLRKFLVSFMGDAIAYQKTSKGQRVYAEVHKKLKETITTVRKEHGDAEIEWTFIAHSLGTVILSNFLYDQAKKAKPIFGTNLFTLGSPIALWTLRFGEPAEACEPVQVLRPQGAWINILDDEDIIGYPLKGLNSYFNKAVDMDYVTEIGGLLSMGNPLSHFGYWKDGNVIKTVSRKLATDYLRIHEGKKYVKKEYLEYIGKLRNV